jgi:hypothetical protein
VGGSKEIMADMTNEEYAALDEKWTMTTPKVNFSRPGMFAQQAALRNAAKKPAASQKETAKHDPALGINKQVK